MARGSASSGEVTALLRAWGEGDNQAGEEVWSMVYDQLRKLARQVRGGRDPRAGTTSLIHEAYLRLLGSDGIDWRERGHFFAIAARAMRFVLADRARRRLAGKRRAEQSGGFPSEVADPVARTPEHVLAVHQALHRLAEIEPRQEKLVELHYFSGLTLDESAEVLGISRRTVMRDWKAVRIWLHGELKTTAAPGPDAAGVS